MSTDAVARRLTQHVTAASASCPTLAVKNVTPHTLRHTFAMRLQMSGIASDASFDGLRGWRVSRTFGFGLGVLAA